MTKEQMKFLFGQLNTLVNDVTTLKESTKWMKLAVIGIYAGLFGFLAQVAYAFLSR